MSASPQTLPYTNENASSSKQLAELESQLVGPLEELLRHPLYQAVNSPERLRVFMENHVFAVWDFMSLLMRLQRDIQGVHPLWRPAPQPAVARFVNEIVLGEASDRNEHGNGFISHFEMYRDAMCERGCNMRMIDRWMDGVTTNQPWRQQLQECRVPQATAEFVTTTLEFVEQGSAAEVASAFCFGREDVIPEMFQRLVGTLHQHSEPVEKFRYYLERHIELDGDEHGPMSRNLLVSVCGDDSASWRAATVAAVKSIQARIRLWDGILEQLRDL